MFPNFEPRYYQQEAHDAIYKFFGENATGNPVVVLPTGTGKSWVIAMFCYSVLSSWFDQRIMVLTHDVNLVRQDLEKMLIMWPTAPHGVFSASIRRKEAGQAITFGNFQSAASHIKSCNERMRGHFGHINLLIIDEAQLVSDKDETGYQFIIAELLKINPKLRVIGTTATPYRMRLGMITDNGIFTHICYDLSKPEDFVRLIKEGFLCPIYAPNDVPKLVNSEGVGIIGGDFNQSQAQALINKDDVTLPAMRHILKLGENRRSWLLFASGVEHSENIAGILNSYGISAAAVHSKKSQIENDAILEAFDKEELRAVVNMNKLTVGYDNPKIDFMPVLRLCNSPGLWVQMMGRGVRTHPQKRDCLALDFVGNTERLGPINDVKIPTAPGKPKPGGFVKICPKCSNRNHARAQECLICGHEFPEGESPIEADYSGRSLIAGLTSDDSRETDVVVESEWLDVTGAFYSFNRGNSRGKYPAKPTMKASYTCKGKVVSEIICFEHSGYARKKAVEWWYSRTGHHEPPILVTDALKHISHFRTPSQILVRETATGSEIENVKW